MDPFETNLYVKIRKINQAMRRNIGSYFPILFLFFNYLLWHFTPKLVPIGVPQVKISSLVTFAVPLLIDPEYTD